MSTRTHGPSRPGGDGPPLHNRPARRTSYPDLSPGVKRSSRIIPQNPDLPTWQEWAASTFVALGPGPGFEDEPADAEGGGR